VIETVDDASDSPDWWHALFTLAVGVEQTEAEATDDLAA
jgi:hypothetical protein